MIVEAPQFTSLEWTVEESKNYFTFWKYESNHKIRIRAPKVTSSTDTFRIIIVLENMIDGELVIVEYANDLLEAFKAVHRACREIRGV